MNYTLIVLFFVGLWITLESMCPPEPMGILILTAVFACAFVLYIQDSVLGKYIIPILLWSGILIRALT